MTGCKQTMAAALVFGLAACTAESADRLRSGAYDHVARLLIRYCQSANGNLLREAALSRINSELAARHAPRLLGLDCSGGAPAATKE